MCWNFYYLLNDGMSFSMLSGKRTLLVIVTGVMLAVLAGMLLLRKMPRWSVLLGFWSWAAVLAT